METTIDQFKIQSSVFFDDDDSQNASFFDQLCQTLIINLPWQPFRLVIIATTSSSSGKMIRSDVQPIAIPVHEISRKTFLELNRKCKLSVNVPE